MADNTLTTKTDPHVVVVDDFNDIHTALKGDFVGRSASTGAASDQERLGTPVVPWLEAHVGSLFLNGSIFDPDNLGVGTNTKNSVSDGRTRAGSIFPDFIRADGTAASATILAGDTDLKYTANNVGVILTADVSLTSLTVAPSSENTATINDSDLSGDLSSKYAGEGQSGSIEIDSAGDEITNRVGQYACFKHGTSELFFAFVQQADGSANTATLTNVFRGFFFDDSGEPIVREVMSDDDTITLMSLGWVFAQNNGTVFDVSYRSPIYSGKEPASAVVDDYWFDLNAQNWFRYDGTSFVEIERTLLGVVVIDGTNCIASRSFDFAKSYDETIDIEMNTTPKSDTAVETADAFNKVSVYAQTLELFSGRLFWDIETDLESGLTEANDTLYYLYVTEEGKPVISDERPYDRTAELKGYYHPYHSWRFVGVAFNDDSGNFSTANSKNNNQKRIKEFTDSESFLPLPNVTSFTVRLWGGGGGGNQGSIAGSAGGTTSFGTYCSATGGAGATQSADGADGTGVGCKANYSGNQNLLGYSNGGTDGINNTGGNGGYGFHIVEEIKSTVIQVSVGAAGTGFYATQIGEKGFCLVEY